MFQIHDSEHKLFNTSENGLELPTKSSTQVSLSLESELV